jgi:pantoate--beta-alanine ligase
MQVIKTVSSMRKVAGLWLRHGRPTAFVPTMGYLHDGHMSLVRRARRVVGPGGAVVVSIYVNPTQFAPNEDFSRYPRDLRNDTRLCAEAGVDVVFAPSNREMYPGSDNDPFSSFVVEETLSRKLEGVSRPGHFRGVTTVVAKLFNIVRPDLAVFGAKDWQQAAIIRRMVRDLNFSTRIIVAPTAREADGLAMSSRNKYLVGDLRAQARVLSGAIKLAKRAVREAGGRGIAPGILKDICREHIGQAPDARIDYVEFIDPETLDPVTTARKGAHIVLAVFIGNTRLIDNARL